MSKKIEFLVACPTGMHIKPLTIIVNEANRFDSQIHLTYDNREVNLKSIMSALALEVPAKAKISIEIIGCDEQAAFDSIVKVLKQQDIM